MTVRVEREAYSLPVFDFAALHTVKFAAPASPNLEVFGLPDSVRLVARCLGLPLDRYETVKDSSFAVQSRGAAYR
jgi:hypothetical protein